jgi:hypothetical protein
MSQRGDRPFRHTGAARITQDRRTRRLGPPAPIKHAESAEMEAAMDITCGNCAVTVEETDEDGQTRHRCSVTGQYVALDAPCGLEAGVVDIGPVLLDGGGLRGNGVRECRGP